MLPSPLKPTLDLEKSNCDEKINLKRRTTPVLEISRYLQTKKIIQLIDVPGRIQLTYTPGRHPIELQSISPP